MTRDFFSQSAPVIPLWYSPGWKFCANLQAYRLFFPDNQFDNQDAAFW